VVTPSTNQEGIWAVVYTDNYDSALEAHQRELQIKSYKGGNAFRKLVRV
jgi:hypothetical protein